MSDLHRAIGPSERQKADAAERSAKHMAEQVARDFARLACPSCGGFQFTDWPHAENGCPPDVEPSDLDAVLPMPPPKATYTLGPIVMEPRVPTCICGCSLVVHDATGKCRGSHGMSGFPCQCWCFREVGKPVHIYTEPDTGRLVELLERIEYNTRSR